VDWIRVDEHGYLVVQGKAGWATIPPTSHCSPNSTRRPGPTDLPPQEKSRTTKPTKPLQPSGTRSRNKNAANTPTTPNGSRVLSRPALRS
jgi:hypothetical protein